MIYYKFGLKSTPDEEKELMSKRFDTLEELKTTVDRLQGRNPTWIFKLYKENRGRTTEIKEK